MKRFTATKHYTDSTSVKANYNTKSISISFTAWEYFTRSTWGHKIRMNIRDNEDFITVNKKIVYYNRTWETYRFQTIIHTAVHSIIKDYKKAKKYCDLLDKYLRNI